MPEIKDCSIASQEQKKKPLTPEEIKKEQENFLNAITCHIENLKKLLENFFSFCEERKINFNSEEGHKNLIDNLNKFSLRLNLLLKSKEKSGADNANKKVDENINNINNETEKELLIHNRCHLTHILGNCQFSLAYYLRCFNKYPEDEKEKETEKVKKSLELLNFYLKTLLENDKALKRELTAEKGDFPEKANAIYFLEAFKEKWEKENNKNTEK